MGLLTLIVIIVVVVAVVGGIVVLLRASTSSASRAATPTPQAPDQIRPVILEFHVRGDEAQVYYAVPLPPDESDRLGELLSRDAVEVVREKQADGLPIDQVVRIRVFARRDGEPAEVGVVDLDEPGLLPEVVAYDLMPHTPVAGHDPLAHLGDQEFDVRPGITGVDVDSELPPLAEAVRLPLAVEAPLRATGLEPGDMSLEDLALGLLRIGGYRVEVERAGFHTAEGDRLDVFTAHRPGSDALVVVLPHRPGEHPELGEDEINRFVMIVAQKSPHLAFLITDKFGPYLMYEKERHTPGCRFITRERLQAFVDSFALEA